MSTEDRLLLLVLSVLALMHGADALRHGYPSEAIASLAFVCGALLGLLFPCRECRQCPAPRHVGSIFCERHGFESAMRGVAKVAQATLDAARAQSERQL